MSHVNTKLLIALAVSALFAVAASAWLGYSRQAVQGDNHSMYVLPGLNGRINNIKTLTITGAENKSLVTLESSDQGWTVREKAGYPADTGKLRELLLNLANAKLLQAKTAKAEHYAALGVEDMTGKDAKGLLITLDGLSAPTGLLVGNPSTNGNGSFVRLPGQSQTWLTDVVLKIDRDPALWLNMLITDIAAERISKVVLTSANGKAVRLHKPKPGDSDFQVADLPPGRELVGPGVANSLASSLTALKLEDVLPGASLPSDQPLNLAQFQSFDGLVIDVTLWKKGNKAFAQFKAELDQGLVVQAIQAEIEKANADYAAQQSSHQAVAGAEAVKAKTDVPAPEKVAQPEQYRQQRRQALQSEIDALRNRFQGWHFVLPEYKYANLVKNLDDLLKPVAQQAKPVANLKPASKKTKR